MFRSAGGNKIIAAKKYNLENDSDVEKVLQLLGDLSDVEEESSSDEFQDEILVQSPHSEDGDSSDAEFNETNNAETNSVVFQVEQTRANNAETNSAFGQTRPLLWKRGMFNPINAIPHDISHQPTDPLLPIKYFERYFTDDHFQQTAHHTNMYHLKTFGTELRADVSEIKQLYGAHLYFGCVKLPRLRMYWDQKFGENIVSEKMARNRLYLLRKCLHFVYTSETPEEARTNYLWKVQPIVDIVRARCLAIRRNFGTFSIDEQMIPFLGRLPGGLRQYVRNKPRPVGLTNFVMTSSSGIVLDFEIYQGSKTPLGDRTLGLGPSVILRLVRSLPENSSVFFDSHFTTLPLMERLAQINIYGTGTIQTNRLRRLSLRDDRLMKRGESDQIKRSDEKIVVVKWRDNKSVILASTIYGQDPLGTVKRWNKEQRSRIEIPCPAIVMQYNQNMGGVDICDQMMECNRTLLKSKKWTLKVALHFLDLAVVNSWMEYRVDCKSKNMPHKSVKDLLFFRLEVAEALLCTPKRKFTQLIEEEQEEPIRINTKRSPLAGSSKRLDGSGHWPVVDKLTAARSCRFQKCNSRTRTRCEKCDVYLCLSSEKNCFKNFHTVM